MLLLDFRTLFPMKKGWKVKSNVTPSVLPTLAWDFHVGPDGAAEESVQLYVAKMSEDPELSVQLDRVPAGVHTVVMNEGEGSPSYAEPGLLVLLAIRVLLALPVLLVPLGLLVLPVQLGPLALLAVLVLLVPLVLLSTISITSTSTHSTSGGITTLKM